MQQPMMQQPMKKERPTGVTILAVLDLLFGLFLLGTGGIAVLGGSALASGTIDPATSGLDAAALSALGAAALLAGILAIVAGMVDILAAIGLFGLKKWGLTLAMLGQLLTLAGTVYSIVQGTPISGQILNLAIPALILLYLFSPGVRKAFA